MKLLGQYLSMQLEKTQIRKDLNSKEQQIIDTF